MTKSQGYITELKRLGFSEITTKSTRFQAFQHPKVKSLVFVGSRGNVRWGQTVSDSRAIYRPEKLLNHLQQEFIEEVVK